MNTKMLIKCLLATAAISAAFPAPVNGDIVPALWGVADKHVPLLSFSHSVRYVHRLRPAPALE